MTNAIITVERDSEPCPLTRERRWTARDNTRRFVSSGESRRDAIDRIHRRLEAETGAEVFLTVVH